MEKRKLLKIFLKISLIAMQIVTLGPAHKALSIVTNKEYTWKINSFDDSEDLKTKIIQDPDFTKCWVFIAHMLGFGWYGGEGSPRIGDDFIFQRVFENDNSSASREVYYLKGNYDSSDECLKKEYADERLQIKISNVRLIIEPTTLKIGTPRIIYTEPVTIASAVLENISDKNNGTSISFTYTANRTWSKTDNFKLNEKIGVKTKFSVDIPFSENKETKLNIEFDEEQGWEQSKGTIMCETNRLQYNTILYSQDKKQINLKGIEKKLEVPYEAKIYIDYDITLTGFLRGSDNGNANVDHSTHRQTKSITLGGKNGLNAVEDLFDKYSNRYIKGYSEWDWQWINNNFGEENMDYFVNEICTVKRGREIKGIFNAIEDTRIKVNTFNLKSIKTMSRGSGFYEANKVEVKDFKSYKTPVFNVNSVTKNR